jgi:hypothetical protein
MLARTGDSGSQKAAESVLSKVTLVVPDLLREYLRATSPMRRPELDLRRHRRTVEPEVIVALLKAA